jgi:hypothetical protein
MKNQRIHKVIYIVFCSLLATVGLVFAIHYGLRGQPVPKIKLSHFESAEQIAASVLLILHEEIKSHSVIFIGVEPDQMSHIEIADQFLQLSQKDQDQQMHFSEVYIEPKLAKGPFLATAISMDIKSESQKLIQKAKKNNTKLLLVVPTIYSTQLIKEAPVSQLKLSSGLPMMSISMVPLFIGNNELRTWDVPCVRDGDQSGESPLGCAVRDRAVVIGYNKVKKGKIAGQLEQYGIEDYLLFLHYDSLKSLK